MINKQINMKEVKLYFFFFSIVMFFFGKNLSGILK